MTAEFWVWFFSLGIFIVMAVCMFYPPCYRKETTLTMAGHHGVTVEGCWVILDGKEMKVTSYTENTMNVREPYFWERGLRAIDRWAEDTFAYAVADRELEELIELKQFREAIDELRKEELTGVTIWHDNPDFIGKNCAVEWHNAPLESRMFYADTVLQALQEAVKHKKRVT